MSEVKLRKWARILPGYVWAVGLDAIDFLSFPISFLVPVDTVLDVPQAIASFLIFDDVYMWGGGLVELALPAGFDLFPSYTALYIARSQGWIK